MAAMHLTDRQWAFIQLLLPPPARTGRLRTDDRRTIEGTPYVLITGCRWQDLPREYGGPTTVWQRLKHWGSKVHGGAPGGRHSQRSHQQGQLDWTTAFLDGSFAPAKKGGDKVGLTRKGKGTKWMLVIDGHGSAPNQLWIADIT